MTQKKLIIFMPSIEGGGVEKNLFIISNYLCKKIEDISLITASKKYKKFFDKKINIISPKNNFWDNCGRKTKYLICLLILFKQIFLKKNNIILCFQANVYCTILCKLLNTKIIVRSNSSPSGWSKNLIKNLIFKIVLKKADKVLVNSLQFKNQLKKKFNIKAKCIYNPLNFTEINKRSKYKTKKYFKNKNSLKIINIGRYTDQKDQITFLRALNLIKDKIKFEVIILGRGILKDDLNNYIKRNNLNKNVKLLNFVKNPYPIIKQADISVLSSKFEGLPNVLLESIALKKFIISSKCPTGPKEILMDGKGGFLFEVGNYIKLSNYILFYLKNKNSCKKMSSYAFKKLDRFDYKINLNKYYKIIKSLN